ncbi:hypothetical protein BGZ98_002781 [Dissophora globulifera]|nr:hypothetical protein BGZ98_002781 [Dissophora globulifera]
MVRSDVSFRSGYLKLVGHLYVPTTATDGKKLPAIITVHPFSGVKEQTSGVYAEKLSEACGVVSLAFDRRHNGSSEGEPRQLEDGWNMIEDIKAAVTYLSTLDNVDPERIGVLGVCAGGGYALCATATDNRIKAIATVSAVCAGGFIRSVPKDQLDAIIEDAGKARTEYARTGDVKYLPLIPDPKDFTDDTPPMMVEGYDYYVTPRGNFPTWFNRTAIWSYDLLTQYFSFERLGSMRPRPMLLIAGSKAETLPYSEDAYKRAQEPKELYLVEGRSHVDLYDKSVPEVVPKLKEFFDKNL